MRATFDWAEIRAGLRETSTETIRRSVTAVGKVRPAELPEDIADMVLGLFWHFDPEIRVESVRAIGVHWRLGRAVSALAETLRRDEDAQVRLAAIGGLGAVGFERAATTCSVSKILATVALSERFTDYERMVAYVELQHIEGRIDFKQYVARDRSIPDNLATFDMDRSWLLELGRRECPS